MPDRLYCCIALYSLLMTSHFSKSSDISHENCDANRQPLVTSSIKEIELFDKTIRNNLRIANETYIECFNNCSCFTNVIINDLAPFKQGITKKEIDLVRHKGTTYIIFEKKLYRSKDCVFPARCSGVEYILRSVLHRLPNVEFILNSRDWPQISYHFGERGPVFSFSKTSDYLDIHFPAWSFWEGGPAIKTYPRGIGRWDLMHESLLEESEKWPWKSKLEMGFFRGSRTSEERDTLILLSRKFPELLDCQYTKNQAWKSPEDTLHAEPASEVSFEHHCRYKYLFNMRGVAASFRLKHLFLCGSLVIHFGEDWTEFFYTALKPWVHYIPLPTSATQDDILKMISFLKENDEIAYSIAKRGQQFVKDHLKMKNVRCYWRKLLKSYSKLLKFSVTVDRTVHDEL